MDKNLQFQNLFKAYKEAFSEKSSKTCQAEVTDKWNEIKNSADWELKSGIFLRDLKSIALKKKGKLLSFWSQSLQKEKNCDDKAKSSLLSEAVKNIEVEKLVEDSVNTIHLTSAWNSKPTAKVQEFLQKEINILNGDLVGLYKRKYSGLISDDQLGELNEKRPNE